MSTTTIRCPIGRSSNRLQSGRRYSVCLLLAVLGWVVATYTGCADPTPLDTPAAAPPSQPPAPTAPVPTVPAPTVPAPTVLGSAEMPGDNVVDSDGPTTGAGARRVNLRYRWEKEKRYYYSVERTMKLGGTVQTRSSGCFYNVDPKGDVDLPEPFSPTPKEGTGTAFVVNSDGYLLTCAHVVKDASKIEVTLDGKQYAGTVVAMDEDRDLAVLRIPANDLPTLPMANSDAVQLGQEVRAVGFPLTNVLGNSIKVTRGTVAGILVHKRFRLFQVDASINPGNSGGPLVNEQGAVVGVNSAKLVGEIISTVGFAVPANQAKRLLESKKVAYGTNAAAARLSGPELAKRVRPAVALVRVTTTAGRHRGAQRTALRFFVVTTPEVRPGRSLARIGHTPEQGSGTLVVNEFGEVLKSTGDRQPTGPMGPLAQVIFTPLPPRGERKWTTETATVITQTEGEQSPERGGPMGLHPSYPYRRPPMHRRRPGYPGMPRYPNPYGSSAPKTKLIVHPAMERVEYEVIDDSGDKNGSGDKVVIRRRYELRTLSKGSAPPYIHIVGEGKTTFDTKVGVPQSMEFRATLTCTQDNITIRVPFTLSHELRKIESMEAVLARAKASREAATKAAAARKAAREAARKAKQTTPEKSPSPSAATRTPSKPNDPAKPNDTDKLNGYLRDLKSPESDWSKRYLALSRLSRMEPIEARRDEVAEVLEPFLTDLNSSLRNSALKAVATWGTKKNVPTLMKLLDQLNTSERWPAMKALSKIKDKQAAEKIARLVPNSTDNSTAARALKEMGGVAEDAVIKLLKHDSPEVRRRACGILRKIGGKKSRRAIEKMLKTETDRSARSAAESALRDLKQRT